MRSHTQPLSQKQFLSTLSASMHEMAQPLSTIQASLELALLCPTTIEQYRWVAEDALMQLQRVVESMQFTAQLTRFHQPAADIQDVLLSAVLEEVISDLQRTFDDRQRIGIEQLVLERAVQQPEQLFPVVRLARQEGRQTLEQRRLGGPAVGIVTHRALWRDVDSAV